MTDTELKEFYEKLYFLEAEARDKIHSRLQLPLTLILAIIGAVAFLLQNYDSQVGTFTTVRVPFLFFLGFGGLCIAHDFLDTGKRVNHAACFWRPA